MHEPRVVESKQISNEQVSYRIVCCGEACGEQCRPDAHVCEDSWHTMYIHEDDHEAQLEERKKEVAARHAKMVAWREKQKGNEVEHG